MAKLDFRDKWILVTGASSGLGRAIALYLAKQEGANLIITARREQRLRQLKEEIETHYQCSVHVIKADLSVAVEVEKLFEEAVNKVDVYGIVNNAGLTFYGPATLHDLETFKTIMKVNFQAVMTLCLYFMSYFKKRGYGAILNITSEAAFMPLPYQSAYSASKHAVQAFSEGIYRENQQEGIVICMFAPGGIKTEMLEKSGLTKKISKENLVNMHADKAARKAVRALKRKRYLTIPGIINKSLVFVIRFIPRKVVSWGAGLIYRPPRNGW